MEVFKVGECIIDKRALSARCGDRSQELSDRSANLLAILAKANNQVVPREQLLEQLWPGRIVTDDSLTNLVSVTRAQFKELGVDSIIKTVPKKGYSLVGDVRTATDQQDAVTAAQDVKSGRLSLKTALIVIGLGIVLVTTLLASRTNDKLNLAILPVQVLSQDTSKILGDGLLQELQHTATDQKNLSVLSRSQTDRAWAEVAELEYLNSRLGADYVLESQLREQGNYLRVTMQWVNAATSEAIQTGAYDVLTDMLDSHHSKIWRDISHLFVESSLYNLGLNSIDKEQAAIDLCDSYYRHFLLYKDGFLNGIELIAQQGVDICTEGVRLSPKRIDAHTNRIALYDALIKGDLPTSELKKQYFNLIAEAIEELRGLPNSDLAVADSQILYNIVQLSEYARDINLQELFDSSEITIQQFEHGEITADFANRAGVIRQRHITYLLRQGENADEMRERAHYILDRGLELEPNNKHLLYTKGTVHLRHAWILVQRGENPSVAYTNAIAFYESSLMQGDARAVNYDAIANAQNNLAKWNVSQGLPFKENVRRAEENYKVSHSLSKTYHRSRNNAADMYSIVMLADTNDKAQFTEYFDKGVKLANAALKIKPDYPYPNLVLAVLHHNMSRADYANNNGSLLNAIQCEQYENRGLQLMSQRASLYAALALCQISATQINIQQKRLDEAAKSNQLLAKTIGVITESGQSSYISLQVEAEFYLLQSTLLHLKGSAEESGASLSKAVDLFKAAFELNDKDRELTASLIKSLLLMKRHGLSNVDLESLTSLIRRFNHNFSNDGRAGKLMALINTDTIEVLSFNESHESYVQFVQRASFSYDLQPFYN